jgi:hypothetical protein
MPRLGHSTDYYDALHRGRGIEVLVIVQVRAGPDLLGFLVYRPIRCSSLPAPSISARNPTRTPGRFLHCVRTAWGYAASIIYGQRG